MVSHGIWQTGPGIWKNLPRKTVVPSLFTSQKSFLSPNRNWQHQSTEGIQNT